MKLFLYCPESTSKETLAMFKAKLYDCVALTTDPTFFWQQVGALPANSVLVLLSHGDTDGPLLVRGTDGADMTSTEIAQLGAILANGSINLYLLSCHTGAGSFFTQLSNIQGVNLVAPLGYAAVGAGGGALRVQSQTEDGKTFLGWIGNLLPARARAATPLQLP